MSLKYLFIIKAVLSLLFGLAFFLAPGEVLIRYGIHAMPIAGLLLVRLFGVTLIGVSVLSWLSRTLGASDARTAIITGLFTIDALAVVVTLTAQLSGEVSNLGWVSVIVYLLLASGFGYYRFLKK